MKSPRRSKKVRRFTRVPTEAEINLALQNTDWQGYWVAVSRIVEKRVDEYALARAKSAAQMIGRRFLMCNA
ncbi:MAG: hypothetical protein WC666_02005 [Candidatus Paceibacterota bacterium]|jgi:hypothetical protein